MKLIEYLPGMFARPDEIVESPTGEREAAKNVAGWYMRTHPPRAELMQAGWDWEGIQRSVRR